MKLKKQLAENQMHQMGYQDAMDGLRMVYKYKDNEDYVKGYQEGSQQKEKESGEDYMPIQKTDLTVASLEEMIKEVMQEYGYGRRRGPMTKKQKKAKQMSWNRKVSELVKAMGGSIPMSSWTSDMAFHYNKGKSPQEAAEIFMARTKEEPMQEGSSGPKQGDDIVVMAGGLAGAAGEVMELTTSTQGEPAVVIYLRKDADKQVMGKAGDEVIALVSDVQVDRGIQGSEDSMKEASTSASGVAGGYSKKKKVYQEE